MKRNFSIILAFVCMASVGFLLVPKLPIKLNPSAQLPEINVYFSMNGQSARVVETEVTSKLEAMLSRIKGVENIRSYSGAGYGNIGLRLSKHVNPDMARFEVSTIIRQTWASLPDGVGYPYVYLSGTSEEVHFPYLRYTVNAPLSPVKIMEYINDNIKPRLSDIRGISEISVNGASRMVYRLEYDNTQLQSLHVSVNDIVSAIQSCQYTEFMGVGKMNNSDGKTEWLRLALLPEKRNQAFNPAEIEVKNSDGSIIALNSLVTVRYKEEETSSFFRINGLNSIYLSFTATDEANRLDLSKKTQAAMEKLQKSFPAGYEVHLLYDEGEYLHDEMNKIYFRSGLTVIILLLFVLLIYRNLRYSLVILFSLLINLGIAVIFYCLCGVEMHLYSLAGLTISLTLLIDNSIIMSDQIIHRGNKKAFLAILAATFTTIGALSVIMFMDETIRANLFDFARVIIINLVVSLFTALFLVPALIEKMNVRKNSRTVAVSKKKTKRKKNKLLIFNRFYEKYILFVCRHKRWFFALLILAFGLPVFMLPDKINSNEDNPYAFSENESAGFWENLYNHTLGSTVYREKIKPLSDVVLGGSLRLFAQKVPNGSYDSGQKSETSLFVTATLPNGSTKEQMDVLIRKMERYIGQYSEVKRFETQIESGQRASLHIYFTKQHQRSGFPYLLKSRLISKSLELGGGSWSVYGLGDGFSNDVKEQAGSSRIKLWGYNYDELNARAEAMRDSLLQRRRIRDVTIDSKFSYYKDDYMEFAFRLDKERLAQQNLLPAELYQSLTPLFGRNISAGEWLADNHNEQIRLYSKQSNELDIWNMEHFAGQIGDREYRMKDIATVEKMQTPRDIAKENQQYLLCLQYEYVGAYTQAWKVTDQAVDNFNRNATLRYKSEAEYSRYWWGQENNTTQYALLLLIIVIIYFMTGILFNSLSQPLTVILIIPISYIGLFLTFYLFNLNFDQGGYAAFILLTGTSVNANIYMLNEYNNIRRRRPHLAPLKAFVKAWNVKVRPIFLTVISTVLGFIPFIVGYKEAFWYPLAAGSIGGLLFSFVAMFMFLPLFHDFAKAK